MLAWAQMAYPQFFAGPQQDGNYEIYSYRYYPTTGNYIGVSGTSVYVLGPVSGSQILHVGTFDDFACRIYPSDCVPPAQTWVADIGGAPLKSPATADFEPGNTFTMEGWVFVNERLPHAWLMGKGIPLGSAGTTLIFSLRLDPNGSRFRFGTDGFNIDSPDAPALRTWTHVAAVMDGGAARLYVNGALVAFNLSAESVTAAPTIPLGVGGAFDAAGKHDNSSMPGIYARQFRFWNVARTQAQLDTARFEQIPASTQGLVAAWPLDDSSGTTARDISGDNRPLTKAVAVGASRLAVLEGGPHFAPSTVTLPSGLLIDASSVEPIDFDGDLDLDLIVAQVATATFPATYRRVLAFRNVNGTFVDATDAVLGNLMMVNPRQMIVADFNGDGRPDLLIANTGTDTFPYPGDQSKLLIQSVDGRLVDETATRLPAHISYTHGAAVADINGDGFPDIYMANYIADVPRIYLNDGTGHFTDAPGRTPIDVSSGDKQHPSVAFCDVNNDGKHDLILGGNYYAPNGPDTNVPNLLLMNDGTGHFARDPNFTLPPKLHGIAGTTVRIVCADLNGDGASDLLLATDIGAEVPGLQMLLNVGDGHFTDATAQLNLTFPSTDGWVVDITVVDINGDSRPDVVLRMNSRTFSPTNFSRSVLLNLGGANFVDASEVMTANTTAGLAVGDFDKDGLVDLLVLPPQNGFRVFRGVRKLDLGLFSN